LPHIRVIRAIRGSFVEQLRRLGHDVVTIQETGKAQRRTPDEDVLQLAVADNRAVLTLNRKHFIRLHREQPRHAGIVVCTVDPNFGRQATRIHSAMEAAPDLHGQLIRINRPSQWCHKSQLIEAITNWVRFRFQGPSITPCGTSAFPLSR
jgi:hypothetical protein